MAERMPGDPWILGFLRLSQCLKSVIPGSFLGHLFHLYQFEHNILLSINPLQIINNVE